MYIYIYTRISQVTVAYVFLTQFLITKMFIGKRYHRWRTIQTEIGGELGRGIVSNQKRANLNVNV